MRTSLPRRRTIVPHDFGRFIVLGLPLGMLTSWMPPAFCADPIAQTVRTKVPYLVALPETQSTQAKGEIGISVVPVMYEIAKVPKTTERNVSYTFVEGMLGPDLTKNHLVETSKGVDLAVRPARIAFNVTVNNQLSRVFRAMGSVVQFNVCGQVPAVEASGYAQLTNLIIPPRGEQQVTVFGPGLPSTNDNDKCTIGFFLYDVPIKQDAAGNVTEKQNFEWFFTYATQDMEVSVEPPTITKRWVHN